LAVYSSTVQWRRGSVRGSDGIGYGYLLSDVY
jgi:hypothetical protein